MSSTDEPSTTDSPAAIVAGPGTGYRVKFGLFALVMIVMGAWFGYDGFVGWPGNNERLRALKAERDATRNDPKRSDELFNEMKKINGGELRSDMDLLFQKLLCFALPPLGLYLAFRAFRNSRGEYRLEGDVLSVPGHPPVRLEHITEIDRRLWERKGIAYIDYDLGEGKQGTLRLDDYYHDRPPTDEIFKRVERFVGGDEPEPVAPGDAPDPWETFPEQNIFRKGTRVLIGAPANPMLESQRLLLQDVLRRSKEISFAYAPHIYFDAEGNIPKQVLYIVLRESARGRVQEIMQSLRPSISSACSAGEFIDALPVFADHDWLHDVIRTGCLLVANDEVHHQRCVEMAQQPGDKQKAQS